MVDVNNHAVGEGFDRSICDGSHPEVDGACPHYVAEGEEPPDHCDDGSFRSLASMLAKTQCGLCCCPIGSMDALNAAPTDKYDCPRFELHTGDA